jgi:hypothetical protein
MPITPYDQLREYLGHERQIRAGDLNAFIRVARALNRMTGEGSGDADGYSIESPVRQSRSYYSGGISGRYDIPFKNGAGVKVPPGAIMYVKRVDGFGTGGHPTLSGQAGYSILKPANSMSNFMTWPAYLVNAPEYVPIDGQGRCSLCIDDGWALVGTNDTYLGAGIIGDNSSAFITTDAISLYGPKAGQWGLYRDACEGTFVSLDEKVDVPDDSGGTIQLMRVRQLVMPRSYIVVVPAGVNSDHFITFNNWTDDRITVGGYNLLGQTAFSTGADVIVVQVCGMWEFDLRVAAGSGSPDTDVQIEMYRVDAGGGTGDSGTIHASGLKQTVNFSGSNKYEASLHGFVYLKRGEGIAFKDVNAGGHLTIGASVGSCTVRLLGAAPAFT